MRSAANDNSRSLALEERFAIVSEQLCSVTERLDHAERDLDLERASREDIIKAEIERRLAEREKALEAKYAGQDTLPLRWPCPEEERSST